MITLNEYSPKLANEWHSTKNGKRTPFNTSYGSDYEAYWICSTCGHEWEGRVANRTCQESGCPKCKKRWNHSFPELALFFYIKKVFSDAVLDKNMNIQPFKSVDLFIPSKLIVIEYDGVHTHRNKINKDEEKSKRILGKGFYLLRIRENELPEFTFAHPKFKTLSYKRSGEPSVNECIKEVLHFLEVDEAFIKSVNISQDTISILKQLPPVEQKNNLGELYPELENEWHFLRNAPFKPLHFKAKSNYKVWWKCINGHEFDARIISRTKGHGCRYCTGNDVTEESSLAHLYPSIAAEWDYAKNGELPTPNNISAHSNKVVYWICSNCNSSYDKMVNERTGRGENCPYCAGKRANQTNSLVTLRPDLAEEWHPTENEKHPDEVTLGSHYLATWICKRGHVYSNYVYSRVEGKGCKQCYVEFGRTQPHKVSFEKSIANKKPFLLKQWDYEMNEISPQETPAYARQKVWWKCSNGCSWEDEPNVRNSSRCKICRVKD